LSQFSSIDQKNPGPNKRVAKIKAKVERQAQWMVETATGRYKSDGKNKEEW